jgi:proline racemase
LTINACRKNFTNTECNNVVRNTINVRCINHAESSAHQNQPLISKIKTVQWMKKIQKTRERINKGDVDLHYLEAILLKIVTLIL